MKICYSHCQFFWELVHHSWKKTQKFNICPFSIVTRLAKVGGLLNWYQHINQRKYDPIWYIPLMFHNVKLKYKQETNLSDTKLIRPWTIVALQKIHERKIKLTTIKVQLRRNETKGIQSHAYRLTGQRLSRAQREFLSSVNFTVNFLYEFSN